MAVGTTQPLMISMFRALQVSNVQVGEEVTRIAESVDGLIRELQLSSQTLVQNLERLEAKQREQQDKLDRFHGDLQKEMRSEVSLLREENLSLKNRVAVLENGLAPRISALEARFNEHTHQLPGYPIYSADQAMSTPKRLRVVPYQYEHRPTVCHPGDLGGGMCSPHNNYHFDPI